VSDGSHFDQMAIPHAIADHLIDAVVWKSFSEPKTYFVCGAKSRTRTCVFSAIAGASGKDLSL